MKVKSENSDFMKYTISPDPATAVGLSRADHLHAVTGVVDWAFIDLLHKAEAQLRHYEVLRRALVGMVLTSEADNPALDAARVALKEAP